MELTRRAWLQGAAATGLLLAGCSASTSTETTSATAGKSLTLGLSYIPNVQFAPIYLAMQGGFADRGLDVTLRHHGEQEDLFTALQSGTEDVLFASSDEAAVASAGGANLVTFATSYQYYPAVLMVPGDSDIKAVADLKGHTVGLPGEFGSNWYALLAGLSNAGLSRDDVEIVETGYTQVAALSTGKVDSVIGFTNNEGVQLQAARFEFNELELVPAKTANLVGPGLITEPGRLNDDVLAELKGALKDAEQAIVNNPDLGIEATLGYVPTLSDAVQRETADQVLAATMGLWSRDGKVTTDVDVAAFDRMAKSLLELGLVEKQPKDLVIEV